MDLKEKIRQAPVQPGCYLFKDADGRIIYIGKAKVIRNRVRQYFVKTNQQDDKGLMLAKLICDVEFHITATERDALMEEYRLIKQYRPWFNVQHKADRLKKYHLILNRTGLYPAMEILADPVGPSDLEKNLLGSFRSEGRAREAVLLLGKTCKTPICSRRFETVTDPCLHYQVGRCLGPCTGRPDPAEYEAVLKDIARLMQGKASNILKEMKRELKYCAEHLEFEKAAVIKQAIDELEQLRGRAGKITIPGRREAMLAVRAFREEGFSLFYFKQGQVRGRCEFDRAIDEEKLGRFLEQTEVAADADNPVTVKCLEDISADRKLIILPREKEREKRLRYVKKSLSEWI